MTGEPRRVGELLAQADRLRDEYARPVGTYSDRDPGRREERWRRLAPPMYRRASLADLSGKPGELVGEWIESIGAAKGRNLVLMGPMGTGKTHALLSVVRHLVDTGRGVRWWPVGDLFDGLRPNGGLVLADVANAEFVGIDDVGVEQRSDWVAEMTDRIFDERWSEQRSTIVTTNLTGDGLRAHLGERVYDRLRDGAVAIRLDGSSRRGSA